MGGPRDKDDSILGSRLASPYSWKLPYKEMDDDAGGIVPLMENQVENGTENEMGSGMIQWLEGSRATA